MDKCREEFEAYITRERAFPCLEMEPEDSPCAGEYVDATRQDDWEFWSAAWKASRQVIEVDLPEPFDFDHSKALVYDMDDTIECLTSLGIRVKGKEE